jgi:hypothetical protein
MARRQDSYILFGLITTMVMVQSTVFAYFLDWYDIGRINWGIWVLPTGAGLVVGIGFALHMMRNQQFTPASQRSVGLLLITCICQMLLALMLSFAGTYMLIGSMD